MAQAIPAPMIKSLHGRIGNIVFYYRHGKQCVRTHVIPRNPDTEAQRAVRGLFRDAVLSWQAMPETGRYRFNKKARYLGMSGYNLYISEYIKIRISGLTQLQKPLIASDQGSAPSFSDSLTSVSHSNTEKSGLKTARGHKKLHPG